MLQQCQVIALPASTVLEVLTLPHPQTILPLLKYVQVGLEAFVLLLTTVLQQVLIPSIVHLVVMLMKLDYHLVYSVLKDSSAYWARQITQLMNVHKVTIAPREQNIAYNILVLLVHILMFQS